MLPSWLREYGRFMLFVAGIVTLAAALGCALMGAIFLILWALDAVGIGSFATTMAVILFVIFGLLMPIVFWLAHADTPRLNAFLSRIIRH